MCVFLCSCANIHLKSSSCHLLNCQLTAAKAIIKQPLRFLEKRRLILIYDCLYSVHTHSITDELKNCQKENKQESNSYQAAAATAATTANRLISLLSTAIFPFLFSFVCHWLCSALRSLSVSLPLLLLPQSLDNHLDDNVVSFFLFLILLQQLNLQLVTTAAAITGRLSFIFLLFVFLSFFLFFLAVLSNRTETAQQQQ